MDKLVEYADDKNLGLIICMIVTVIAPYLALIPTQGEGN